MNRYPTLVLERHRPIAALSRPPNILLVCTANTCRSPMAAALLVARADAAAGAACTSLVRSAGVAAVAGSQASTLAQSVMAERGLDLTAHRSRDVLAEDVDWADAVWVMTDAHRRALIARWPASASKVRRLAEAAGRVGDVPDPFGGDRATYRSVAALLDDWIVAALDRTSARAGLFPIL